MVKSIELKAKNRFNRIMRDLALEYLMIGKEGEHTQSWNIRDMVAECDYQLSTYYEGGHWNSALYEDDYKAWLSETGKLKRFIARFAPYVKDLKVTKRHSSKFDN